MSTQEIIQGLSPNQRIRIVLPIIVSIAFFECYAQYTLKKGRREGGDQKWICLMTAGVAYAVICYLLYTSYQYDGIGHVNLLWSCISIVLAYAVGVSFFDEHINKYGYLAILFACIAIYFSHLNDENPKKP
jgi:multidrug transporter EmrE-like cation transporter